MYGMRRSRAEAQPFFPETKTAPFAIYHESMDKCASASVGERKFLYVRLKGKMERGTPALAYLLEMDLAFRVEYCCPSNLRFLEIGEEELHEKLKQAVYAAVEMHVKEHFPSVHPSQVRGIPEDGGDTEMKGKYSSLTNHLLMEDIVLDFLRKYCTSRYLPALVINLGARGTASCKRTHCKRPEPSAVAPARIMAARSYDPEEEEDELRESTTYEVKLTEGMPSDFAREKDEV